MCVDIFFFKVDLDISHSKANEQQFTVCDSVGNTRENRFLNPLTLDYYILRYIITLLDI